MKKIYNFSAGPAKLPYQVLQTVQSELLNWQGTGSSVMELSHRNKEFDASAFDARTALKTLLAIPDNYKILFCQGGARGQFAAVPMNILGEKGCADYFESGYWSRCAAIEAGKYGEITNQCILEKKNGLTAVKPISEWKLSPNSDYIHYCQNETIEGVAVYDEPALRDKIVVCDFSSSLLSRPLDVRRYGIIYAAAQKNIGPAGLTIVIVRDDLLGYANACLPSMLNYQILANSNSMYNTPPTFAWYIAGLVFDWIKQLGGLSAMAVRNKAKATALYHYIDHSNFYINQVTQTNRSEMNVTFFSPTAEMDERFVSEALNAGIIGIKGHRVLGGLRASIYNAIELDDVNFLIEFMQHFAQKNKKKIQNLRTTNYLAKD